MTSWTRKTIVAVALAALVCPAPGFAQTHKVSRPDAVVRAVGVYEWTGDLAKPTGTRFVPVTLFIDGEIENAAYYKPQPVPFAILTGNVYELEDGGVGQGTLVLEQAMKAETPDGAPAPPFIDGWTAYGSYKSPIAEKKAAPLRASKIVPAIQVSGGDNSRPHFSNKPAASDKQDASNSTKPSDTTKPADTTAKTDSDTSKNSDDDSRPTLHRRSDPPAKVDDDTSPAQDPNAASSVPKNSGDDPAERPTLRRQSPDDIGKEQKAKKKQQESGSVTAAGSISNDPDRPTLKHGSARGSDDDKDLPKLNGVPADMKQMIAVSDPKNRAQHVFARPWEDVNERSAVLSKMQAFARAKLATYGTVPGTDPPQLFASSPSPAKPGTSPNPADGTQPSAPKLKRGVPTDDTTEVGSVTAVKSAPAANDPAAPKLKRGVPTDNTTTQTSVTHTTKPTTAAKTSSTTKSPTHTTAKGKKPVAKAPPQVELANEQLRGYLLSYGGAPTYVYMAHTVEPGNVTRFITVVAQADTTGQLKVALASATDAAHLDRTPWMRLVDAVDVEASNRASLLFELRGRSSRQFALYRVIAAKPEQIFNTSGGI